MSRVSKILIFLLLVVTATTVWAGYKPTNLDTKLPPKPMEIVSDKPEDVTHIYENKNYVYYFRDERDVLIVEDKRNGYLWKSGLDIPSAKAVKKALRADEPLGLEPMEVKMNETFTDIANSLVTVEYYDDSNNIKRMASATEDGESHLYKVEGEETHFVLEVKYTEIDLGLKVHIYLTDAGYDLEVLASEITGDDLTMLAAIDLSPFLGASGGMYQLYDEETGKHGDDVKKPELPGYVLVPDGSGSLIRFTDYNVSLKSYTGKVYGENPAKGTYNTFYFEDRYVPIKNPLMPVFGISHGQDQNAFVGYATSGDAHMEIVVVPEENTTLYTWAYPRFVYNQLFHQIFNKRGDGYFTLAETPDTFDVKFSYAFLEGDGSEDYSADYVGMALTYRDYLTDEGILKDNILAKETEQNVPMRVDFVMSDQKKSVIGYENSVTTTTDGVARIVEDMLATRDYNLNLGLLGWQDGGITLGDPGKTDFTREIGSKKAFENLLEAMKAQDVDMSLATNYAVINENQMRLLGNAAKHINGWYLEQHVFGDVPFEDFAMARPDRAASWLIDQASALSKLGFESHTIEGISNLLMSEHGSDPIKEEETIALYQTALGELETMTLNLHQPNQYLWKYTDRFLQAPVYPTQFLIETDTVPFLELVLNGSMEVYAPYANFSFSEPKDVLRMIDYNVYPSFVLTENPSYLLSTTNSSNFYSTEYEQYDELMASIYDQIDGALGSVMGQQWIDRDVVVDGIICNRYEDGSLIYINYSKEPYEVMGQTVEPLSYLLVKEEGQ